jgi:hypothetical protein
VERVDSLQASFAASVMEIEDLNIDSMSDNDKLQGDCCDLLFRNAETC